MQADCRVYPRKRTHNIAGSGETSEHHAVMRPNRGLGKQRICFQQTEIQGRQLQESDSALFDSQVWA